MSSPPRPSLARRLGFTVLGAASLLAGLELSLAALGFPRRPGWYEPEPTVRDVADPLIRYELIPGARGRGLAVNAAGFRGPAPGPRRPGRERVVVLGDSVTFGLGLGEDETWPARLGALAGDRAEVLNLALHGYDPVQYARVLEVKGLALAPDRVLIGYCLNDIMVHDLDRATLVGAARVLESFPVPSRILTALVSGYVSLDAIRRIRDANDPGEIARSYGGWIEPLAADEAGLRAAMAAAATDHPVLQDRYTRPDLLGRLRGALGRIGRTLAARAIPGLLVAIPTFARGPDGAYPHRGIHALVAGEARRAGLAVLDLGPRLPDLPVARLRVFPEDDLHPSAEAARWIAAEVHTHLAAGT